MAVSRTFLVCVLLGLALSACQSTSPLYYWGSYEKLVYDMYNRPGSATPEIQIDTLSGDIERAKSQGLRVPPGVYAQLGFMYAAIGNLPAAEVALNEEKRLFPESAVFIDGMLQRAHKNSRARGEN